MKIIVVPQKYKIIPINTRRGVDNFFGGYLIKIGYNKGKVI